MTACVIDGCDKRARGRGWCATHWERWSKHGDPLVVLMPGRDYRIKGTCSVHDCERTHQAKGLCSMHYTRLRKYGELNPTPGTNGRPIIGEHAGYHAAHKRLLRSRGPARNYACIDCGKQAREWSYKGNSPEELRAREGSREVRFTLDQTYYEPRCVRCHRLYDGNCFGARLADPDHPRTEVEIWTDGEPR